MHHDELEQTNIPPSTHIRKFAAANITTGISGLYLFRLEVCVQRKHQQQTLESLRRMSREDRCPWPAVGYEPKEFNVNVFCTGLAGMSHIVSADKHTGRRDAL
ncbi:hypothetical protein CBL_07408 [Carabus blaptoides fortunei]